MQRTFEERVNDLRVVTVPLRGRVISIVMPVLRHLTDGVMYCSLYMDKRRMDKRRGKVCQRSP
ncbi:hypothetical protein D3C76_1622980 [compost metagenome]